MHGWLGSIRAALPKLSSPPAQPRGAAEKPSRTSSAEESMREYTARVLKPWSPLVVSNRAPFEPGPKGTMKKGSGGLVTALITVAEATGAPWVAAARSPAERELAGREPAEGHAPGGSEIHYVVTDEEAYRRYYSVIANPLLWFLQHYLWGLIREPVIDAETWSAWDDGYVAVNQAFARKVVEVARQVEKPPLILTQDYQLYIAPQLIRAKLPQAALQQFIHIPWPTPNYWKVLPKSMRDAIFQGILGNDLIGFQSNLDVRNFLMSCEELMGLRVDHRERAVLHAGRVVWVRSYPISIDVPGLERQAAAAGVTKEREAIRQDRPEKLIVRVDRTDPSKNVVRGFLAYELLLERHPEWHGRVQFYAFLQPSRQDIDAYRDYLREIRRTATRINDRFGRKSWQPIRLELGESMRRALALYQDFDVLLVNPIYDGMNLVAKEGMVLSAFDGALVLSENAGAHEELGQWALTVNPFDVGDTAEALHAGLKMSRRERAERRNAIKEQVATNDIGRWLSLQLRDLRDLVPPPREPGE